MPPTKGKTMKVLVLQNRNFYCILPYAKGDARTYLVAQARRQHKNKLDYGKVTEKEAVPPVEYGVLYTR